MTTIPSTKLPNWAVRGAAAVAILLIMGRGWVVWSSSQHKPIVDYPQETMVVTGSLAQMPTLFSFSTLDSNVCSYNGDSAAELDASSDESEDKDARIQVLEEQLPEPRFWSFRKRTKPELNWKPPRSRRTSPSSNCFVSR
jgi:hypothetical protein